MSEEVGPVDVRESDEHPFLGREMAQPRHFSEATAKVADASVRRLLQEAEDAASRILQTHRAAVETLVEALEKQETLSKAQIATHLGARSDAGQGENRQPARASLECDATRLGR
jgi:cell division protease FtsH